MIKVLSRLLLGILILVKYNLDDTIEYLVKRPWNQLFKCDINQCINAYEKCGAFDYCDFIKGYEPIFAAMDLDLDIKTGSNLISSPIKYLNSSGDISPRPLNLVISGFFPKEFIASFLSSSL